MMVAKKFWDTRWFGTLAGLGHSLVEYVTLDIMESNP